MEEIRLYVEDLLPAYWLKKDSEGEGRVVEEHSAAVWISSLLLIDDHPLLGTFSPQKNIEFPRSGSSSRW